MSALAEHDAVKPRLRGRIHQFAAPVVGGMGFAIILGASLIGEPRAAAVIACTLYALAVLAMFTVSATYHRITWPSPEIRARMKRADHAMIFVLIAGTYTPFAVLGLDRRDAIWVLSIVWSGAAAGIVLKVLRPHSPKWLGVILYLALGWVVVFFAGRFLHGVGWPAMIMLAIGGAFYSVGAVLYATKWPNPWPATFGHHEFFHAATVLAAVAHYIAVWFILVRP